MKKIISAVLALLLLATCLTPSIGAIDATQDEVVLFTDCDSLDGWSGYGLKPPALDTAVFKDGRGSISMTLDGRVEATVPGQHFNMQYSNEARPLNVTGMHTLIFDLYVQNVAGIKNVKFEIELRSPGGDDNNELVRRATFNELVEGGLREGWNRVELPLSTMLRNGSFDDTQCTYFRIYNYPTTLGSEGKVTAMKLDNVSFVGVPVEDGEEDQDNMELLFCNCDNISGWSGYGHNPPVLDTTVVKEGAGSISMRLEGSAEATAPGQHFNMQYKNESKPLNVTGMHTLVFDLYVQNVAGIENVKFEIELRSPGGNDNNELVRRATLGELVEGGLREGWNRAELPLDSMVQVGSFDKAQCTYFRMYNYPTTLGTDGKTTVLNIDHLRFLGALDPAMYEDVMLADCDTTGGWSGVGIALDRKEMSQGKGSISTTIKGFKPNAGHGSAIQSIYTRTKGVNVAHLNTLAFDLYVENVQGVAKTTFEFELRSPGGSDHNELMCVTLLDGIAVSGMLTEGWNQIEIPLKDFVRNGTVDLTNCNYFRVYNRQGDIGVADENTVFKLDNIRFIYVDEAAGPRATICCSYLADGAV